jgi:predicted NAD/FAD-binding protein
VNTTQPGQRIAVIGAGISGLTAAYLLSRAHEVTVFEANDYAGGHTHTIPVETPDGRCNVDTGFIVYNDRTYPNFIALLTQLGVAGQRTGMSFSVRNERSGIEYRASTLNGLFAQRRNLLNPRMYRLIAEILRFGRQSPRLLEEDDTDTSLSEYLQSEHYSEFFITHFIVPMGAAIWSSSIAAMMAFPASFFIRFFHNHGFLNALDKPHWCVIKGGSWNYVAPLSAPYREQLHLNAPVAAITRRENGVEIRPRGSGALPFDQVVIAAHSDQALRMLTDPDEHETRVLGALPYQANETVLHSDTSLMPRARRAWASWNYHMHGGMHEPVAVSYNMNILQSLDFRRDFIVTLNAKAEIDRAKIIAEMLYHHPLFTREGVRCQDQQDELNGRRRTWFCGAYWRYGFHEDGVVSALNVCRRFGIGLTVPGCV